MAHRTEPKLTKRQAARQPTLNLKTDATAIYLRVSTEKQVSDGFSLDAQEKQLRAYCELHGWTVDCVFRDEGYTGTKIERPSFTKMTELVKARGLTRILVSKLDRLARSTRDFLQIVDLLQHYGFDLVIVKENFDTGTPQGKFAITMFAALAELEASMITDRVMSGKHEKASTGGYNGSRCPYGYTYQAEKFVVNLDQAETIRFIFDRWLAGDSMNSIAGQLNASGTPTQRGAQWAQPTIRYIVLNGFYAGLAQWDGVEVIGSHPPIVDPSTYHAAIARLATARRGNPHFAKQSA